MRKIWLYLVICFFGACQQSQTPPLIEGKPLVLVTIAPYKHFVEKIGGDTVRVATLVPSGVNMHIYEPTIHEMTVVKEAKVWFRIGEPFERPIAEVLKVHQPQMNMVELWKGLPLLTETRCSHHREETQDRHIWMSPKLMIVQCEEIAKALTELQPKYAVEYTSRLEAVQKELGELDRQLHALLQPFAGSVLLVSHPALGYFCQEYHLVQLSVECAEKDPLPRDIERILREAKDHPIRAVFTQAGYSNKGAELIAKRLQLPVFKIDPYAKEYSHNLLHIAKLIAYPSG